MNNRQRIPSPFSAIAGVRAQAQRQAIWNESVERRRRASAEVERLTVAYHAAFKQLVRDRFGEVFADRAASGALDFAASPDGKSEFDPPEIALE